MPATYCWPSGHVTSQRQHGSVLGIHDCPALWCGGPHSPPSLQSRAAGNTSPSPRIGPRGCIAQTSSSRVEDSPREALLVTEEKGCPALGAPSTCPQPRPPSPPAGSGPSSLGDLSDTPRGVEEAPSRQGLGGVGEGALLGQTQWKGPQGKRGSCCLQGRGWGVRWGLPHQWPPQKAGLRGGVAELASQLHDARVTMRLGGARRRAGVWGSPAALTPSAGS